LSPLTNRLKREELFNKETVENGDNNEITSNQSQETNIIETTSREETDENTDTEKSTYNLRHSSMAKPKPLRKNGQFSPSPFTEDKVNGNQEKRYSSYKEFMYDSTSEISDDYSMPTLTKDGYETRPSLSVLKLLPPHQLKSIENFTIERKGVGLVEFPGYTNVLGLDINSIIIFNHNEMIAYPEGTKKPPIGSGLNKKAIITLLGCRPKKDLDSYYKKYEARLKTKTIEWGGKFLGYTRESGAWSFELDHL